MLPDQRRAGRAVRKQRRRTAEALKAFSSVDWGAIVDDVNRAFEEVAHSAVKAKVAMYKFVEAYLYVATELQAEMDRVDRMNYRALEELPDRRALR